MEPKFTQSILEYVLDLIPDKVKCCKCCEKNNHYSAFEVAREKLETETNIIEIVKQLRFFELALASLLSQKSRKAFKLQSRYKKISLNDIKDDSTVALKEQEDSELIELRNITI
jgi:hypothetical protein